MQTKGLQFFLEHCSVCNAPRGWNGMARTVIPSVGYTACVTRLLCLVARLYNCLTAGSFPGLRFLISFSQSYIFIKQTYESLDYLDPTPTSAVTMTKRKNNARKVANVVTHFTNTYTYDDGRLLAFQTLCRDLRVSVGTSLTQCKKVCSTERSKVDC